jgi:hypothetical protein
MMPPKEIIKVALGALAWMCQQFMSKGPFDDEVYHRFESAGQLAVEVLVAHELMVSESWGGKWTEAGRALLAESCHW